MKKIFLHLLLLLFATTSFAQDYFESLTFKQALKKAERKNKLVLVQLQSVTCMQCNEVGSKGLSAPGVQEVAEKYFVPILLKPGDKDWQELSGKYKIEFGSLFFDNNGQLIEKFTQTTSWGQKYILEMKSILEKRKNLDLLNEYEKRYLNGEKDSNFLTEFIKIRCTNKRRCDTLTEEFIKTLVPDNIKTKENILLLIKTAPLIGSYTDSIIRKDGKLFSEVWNSMPLPERITINQEIIVYSRQKAIKNKDLKYAIRVSNFTYKTYESNFVIAQKAKEKQMLYYYFGTKDSNSFFALSDVFVQKYLMSITKDSINKIDTKQKEKVLHSPVLNKEDTNSLQALTIQKESVSFVPAALVVANELREMARFARYLSDDSTKLEKPLLWLNRAIELTSSPNLLEDKAKVLLKIGKKEDAIKTLEEAYLRHKSSGFSGQWILNEIDAIKKDKQLPDDEY